VIYAYLVDGLEFDKREEFDRVLLKAGDDTKAKAVRERQAVQNLMNIPGVAGGA